MKFLIQRVSSASVIINANKERSIENWLLISVWINKEDYNNYKLKINGFVRKIGNLKFFEDNVGKINNSLSDQKGELLIISNFTLYWRNKKWSKIDFSQAAGFIEAKEMYDYLISSLETSKIPFEQGEFWAYMQVSSVVDGPVNVVLEM